MNNYFLFILILAKFGVVKSQNLFLVSSTPLMSGYEDGGNFNSYVYLFDIKSNDLIIIDTLSKKNENIFFMKKNMRDNSIYYYKEKLNSETKYIHKIYFSNNYKNKCLKLIGKKLGLTLEENILIKDIDSNYRLLISFMDIDNIQSDQFDIIKPKYQYYVFNVDSLKYNILDENYYSRFYSEGTAGGVIEDNGRLRILYDTIENKIKIPVTYDYSERPSIDNIIIDKYSESKAQMLLEINDLNMSVISFMKNNINILFQKKIDSIPYFIFNKKSKASDLVYWKGNASILLSHDTWISGFVRQYYTDEYYKPISWESPGYKERQKVDRKYNTGELVDFRYQSYGIYQPGILFLYDINTHDYIEWDTKQGDSEILLVKDNIVYYRVNDQLYKANIVNHKFIDKPILIFQHPLMVDSHWLFLK